MMKLKLEPVYCHKCGHLLIWTVIGAKVFCPKCNVWAEARRYKDAADMARAKAK
jgi:predicted Zn-ribbon and HTH transcriptional regulator